MKMNKLHYGLTILIAMVLFLSFGCTTSNVNSKVSNIKNTIHNGEHVMNTIKGQTVSLNDIDSMRVESVPSVDEQGKGTNYIYVIFSSKGNELAPSALPENLNLKAHLVAYSSEYNATMGKRVPVRKVYEGDFIVKNSCISDPTIKDKSCYIKVPFSAISSRQKGESISGIFNLTVTLPNNKTISDLGYNIKVPLESEK